MEHQSHTFNDIEHIEDDDNVLLPDKRKREEILEHLETPDQQCVVTEKVIQEAPEEFTDVSEHACSDLDVDDNVQHDLTKDLHPSERPCRSKYALKCAIVPCITFVLLGIYIRVLSGAAVHIKQDLKITNISVEALTGILNGFVLLGSAMAAWIADWKGRRYTVVLAGAILFFAPLVTSFAPSYSSFVIGHFLANIGVGYANTIAPVYIAEISPAFSRGWLTSLPETFLNGGTVISYVFNYVFSKLHINLGWHVLLSVGVTSLALLAIKVLHMPESPRWLVMHGRLGEAEHVLADIYSSKKDAAFCLDDIKAAAGIPKECKEHILNVNKYNIWEGIWRDLLLHRTPSMCHSLICIGMIHFFQQALAIETVLLIFKKANITYNINKLLFAIDLVKTVFTPVASLLIDRVGRRPLLLFSNSGIVLSLAFLGTCLAKIHHSSTKLTLAVNMSIVSVLFHVFFFSVGMGPVTSVYSSEIFPLQLRPHGCAIGIAVTQVVRALLTMMFVPLSQAMTASRAAYLLMVIAMSAFVFVDMMMPETKGKTLEEIGLLFGKKSAPKERDMQRIAT